MVMAANSRYKNHLNSFLLQRMDRKEHGDVELDSEEEGKKWSVEGSGMVKKIDIKYKKQIKSTTVAQKFHLTRENELPAVADRRGRVLSQ